MSEDYIVVAHKEEFDMTYQFYVDEKYLYLLDNTLKKYNDGIIYRIDEAGELVTLQYVVEREGNKNRILTWIIPPDGIMWQVLAELRKSEVEKELRDELRKQQMQIEDSKTACQIQIEKKE